MGTGNYSAISNNMKLVHWPLMGGLLRLVQRWYSDEVTGRGSTDPTGGPDPNRPTTCSSDPNPNRPTGWGII